MKPVCPAQEHARPINAIYSVARRLEGDCSTAELASVSFLEKGLLLTTMLHLSTPLMAGYSENSEPLLSSPSEHTLPVAQIERCMDDHGLPLWPHAHPARTVVPLAPPALVSAFGFQPPAQRRALHAILPQTHTRYRLLSVMNPGISMNQQGCAVATKGRAGPTVSCRQLNKRLLEAPTVKARRLALATPVVCRACLQACAVGITFKFPAPCRTCFVP